MKKILFISLSFLALSSYAQMTPVGVWQSIDDVTKAATAEFTITEKDGVLTGNITKFLRPNPNLQRICDKCQDDRKDKLLLGMELIRGAVKAPSKNVWEGGKLLDPDSGSVYTLRMTPIDDGKKLEVRGSFLFISRTQTWNRVN